MIETITIFLVLFFIIYWALKSEPENYLNEKHNDELLVSYTLSEFAGEKYLLNNVIIKNNDTTAEIDHILITEYGVFVFETKSYAGTIYGQEDELNWTQVLNFGRTKNIFYNPIKQNKTHIYALDKLFHFSQKIFFINMVIFTKSMPNQILPNVISINSLNTFLETIPYKYSSIYNANQMFSIYKTILNNILPISKDQHIQNINNLKNNISNNICPRCGAPLILKEDGFYKCTNYPKCKFIKQKAPTQ